MKHDAYHPPLNHPPIRPPRDPDLFGARGRLVRMRALRAGLLESHWQKWEAECADVNRLVQFFTDTEEE